MKTLPPCDHDECPPTHCKRAMPCSVERTSRSVIEKKLLAALDDGDKVAILASKQDLEDMIAALCGYELAEQHGKVLSWESYRRRCKSLSDDMTQLLHEAFPSKIR